MLHINPIQSKFLQKPRPKNDKFIDFWLKTK